MSARTRLTAALRAALAAPPVAAAPAAPEPRRPGLRRSLGDLAADAVASVMTGLGIYERDAVRSAAPAAPVWLGRDDMDALATADGIIRRLIWAPPEDAIRDGWATQEGDDRDATEALDADLCLPERIIELDATARQYGGAWLWMVIRGDDDTAEPLGPGPHDVAAVHVFSRFEVSTVTMDEDPESEDWGTPEVVRITPTRENFTGRARNVHVSRLVYMPGLSTTRTQRIRDGGSPGGDLSVPQAYWEAVRDLGMAYRSAGLLLINGSTPVLKSAGLAEAATGDEGDLTADEMAAFARTRSALGVAVIHPASDFSWASASMSGWGEPLRALQERVSAVEGIPLSEVYGQAPGGFSTDDASSRAKYHRFLSAHRSSRATPALLRVYDVALGPSPDRQIVWSPLDEPTEEEQARTSLARMQRDQIGVLLGAYSPAAVRGRFDGAEELALPVLEELPEPVLPKPGAMLPEREAEEATEGLPAETPEQRATRAVKEVALNGAQVSSALDVVKQVAARELPRQNGVEALVTLLGLERPQADALMGDVGRTFFSAPEAQAAETPEQRPIPGED